MEMDNNLYQNIAHKALSAVSQEPLIEHKQATTSLLVQIPNAILTPQKQQKFLE